MSTTSIVGAGGPVAGASSGSPPDEGSLARELIAAHTSGGHLDATGLAQATAKVSAGLGGDQQRALDEAVGAQLRRSSMSDAFAFSQAQVGGARITPADRAMFSQAQTGGAAITAADRGAITVSQTGGARLDPAAAAGFDAAHPDVGRFAFAQPLVGGAAPTGASASVAAASGTGGARLTADQLRQIMPAAGAQADRYVDALNTAMDAHGITSREQQAAFLGQIAGESGQLHSTTENLNYTHAARIAEVWPHRFTTETAAPYVRNPEGLANTVYARRNGNGDEASGDGYLYRGRGLMQTTGRDNYRAVGHESDPQALEQPDAAADSAARFWQDNGLNARTQTELNRTDFNGVTQTVNNGQGAATERWQTYQRALTVLGGN